MPSFPAKATLAILTLVVFLTVPDYIPAFKDYKVLDWRSVPAVLDFQPRNRNLDPVEQEQARLRPDTDVLRAEIHPLVDSGGELDRFYASLLRTERREGKAVTRILHYGDSPTTADMITADVRSLLQKDFGDAGHGFALIAKPWAWYNHRGVDIQAGGWKIEPANAAELKDGQFGLGAVSFRAENKAWSRMRLADSGTNLIEVSYLQQPGGGKFSIYAGEDLVGVVETAGETSQPGFASFELTRTESKFEIRDVEGKVRLYGWRFEKSKPGIVYNSLGVNGAYIAILSRMEGEQHWREQLRHAKPDLVIINYGTNESVYSDFVNWYYEKELRTVLRRIRTAVPDASILLMSPMDRGQRKDTGEIGTVPLLPKVVSIKQRVAADTNCAFFNTFEAMGGSGTMGRWYQAEPRLVGADFIHPMPAGAKIVGNLLYKALMDGYNNYKSRRLKQSFATIEKPGTKTSASN